MPNLIDALERMVTPDLNNPMRHSNLTRADERRLRRVILALKAAETLSSEATSVVSFFNTYVVSAKDSSGREVFEETGGVDGSFSPLTEAANNFNKLLNKS